MTFPVPGPISRTTSVDRMDAFSTMDVTTAGFFKKCCPNVVFGVMRLAPLFCCCCCWLLLPLVLPLPATLEAYCDDAALYGECIRWLDERFPFFAFGMIVHCKCSYSRC